MLHRRLDMAVKVVDSAPGAEQSHAGWIGKVGGPQAVLGFRDEPADIIGASRLIAPSRAGENRGSVR